MKGEDSDRLTIVEAVKTELARNSDKGELKEKNHIQTEFFDFWLVNSNKNCFPN